MLNADQLYIKCTKFEARGLKTFQEIVKGYVDLRGTTQKDLARDCEVAISTISRWVRGASCPGKHVQEFVVRKIQKRVRPSAKEAEQLLEGSSVALAVS